MPSAFTAVPLIVLWIVSSSDQFVNEFDKEARLQCSDSQTLSHIGAVYNGFFKDRRWRFGCRRSVPATKCFWTSSQNMWDQPLKYSCPDNTFLNGMFSFHLNVFEDRRFSLKCCLVPWKWTHDCFFTDFVNDWHAEINYYVPDGYVIKGVYSYHENSKEDRRWQFNICRF